MLSHKKCRSVSPMLGIGIVGAAVCVSSPTASAQALSHRCSHSPIQWTAATNKKKRCPYHLPPSPPQPAWPSRRGLPSVATFAGTRPAPSSAPASLSLSSSAGTILHPCSSLSHPQPGHGSCEAAISSASFAGARPRPSSPPPPWLPLAMSFAAPQQLGAASQEPPPPSASASCPMTATRVRPLCRHTGHDRPRHRSSPPSSSPQPVSPSSSLSRFGVARATGRMRAHRVVARAGKEACLPGPPCACPLDIGRRSHARRSRLGREELEAMRVGSHSNDYNRGSRVFSPWPWYVCPVLK